MVNVDIHMLTTRCLVFSHLKLVVPSSETQLEVTENLTLLYEIYMGLIL